MDIKAEECKCVECDKQAVAFYPCIDLDIPSRPYCRKCLDDAKLSLLMKIYGYDKRKIK